MKKIVALIFIFFFILLLSSCKTNVSLKGNDSIIIELGMEYEDEGINIPSNYHYDTSDNININKTGSYYYKYEIYNKSNKKLGELNRVVTVKDTTAPTYKEKDIDHLLVGKRYYENYFFDSIIDKSTYSLKSEKAIIFFEEGRYEVNIIISDKYNNICEFRKEYNVIDDKDLLLEELKEEEKYIKYEGGDFKVNYSDNKNEYFYFHKMNNDYIYEINYRIDEYNSSDILNYKYVISVSSQGLSEQTYIEYGDKDKVGISFIFNAYELEDWYLNHPEATDKIKQDIKNAYALLVFYIEMFSVN